MMNKLTKKLGDIRQNGRKIIGCFPLYPPLELLHALGLESIVMWGFKPFYPETRESDQHIQNYACSMGRHLAEFVYSREGELLDGILFYNACDTLRNLPEILAWGLEDRRRRIPFFRFHLPMAPRSQSDAAAYLRKEVQALTQSLSTVYKVEFSAANFRSSTELYVRARELARRLENEVVSGRLSFERFADLIQGNYFRPVDQQIEWIETELDKARTAEPRKGPGAILSGIMAPPPAVCRIMEEAGLHVVGNDIASLARSYSVTLAPSSSPEEYYEDFYYNHTPCTTLLGTADDRLATLQSLIDERHAQGVIFLGEKFCEYEYFEFPYLEEQFKKQGLPTLLLEFAIDSSNLGSVRTRVEAFAEMIC